MSVGSQPSQPAPTQGQSAQTNPAKQGTSPQSRSSAASQPEQGAQPQRRLGRGLEALLGGAGDDGQPQVREAGARAAPAPGVQKVPISKVDPNPFQPRREFDAAELDGLGESLKTHGIIQPLVVRLIEGRYQLIAGERRLRAAQKIGWNTVPVRIIDADDRQVAEVAIIENLQRKDLNPLEKASAFQRYLKTYKCKQEELAKRIGIDRSTVSNLIRLLELPDPIQKAVRDGAVSAGHARALLPLGEEKEQVEACKKIQSEGLSVRATEQLVKTRLADEDSLKIHDPEGEEAKKPAEPESSDEHLASLEQDFRTALGTKVDLKQGPKGTGRITIHFNSHEEFERIRKHLLGGSRGRKAG